MIPGGETIYIPNTYRKFLKEIQLLLAKRFVRNAIRKL